MTNSELEERIAALEGELERLIAARATGRAAAAVEVVDEAGRTRAMLSTGHGGLVSLNLLDTSGRLRAALGIGNDGPTLSLFGPAGKPLLDLHVGADDAPRLALHDAQGVRRLDANVDPMGTASVGIAAQDGAPKALMMATGSGRGVVGASR